MKKCATLPVAAKPKNHWGQKLTVGVLLLVSLIWCSSKLSNPAEFPIKSVKIIDSQSYLNPLALEKCMMPFLDKGLIWIPVDHLQKNISGLPWVKSAVIGRTWPDILTVRITEEHAVGCFDNTHLINNTGDIFNAGDINNVVGLPQLNGPLNQSRVIWNMYQSLSALFIPLGLKIKSINLSDNGGWEIELDNKLSIILGTNDIVPRVQRFIGLYPKIFNHNNPNTAEYIDLRYNHGLAIRWKTQENVKT